MIDVILDEKWYCCLYSHAWNLFKAEAMAGCALDLGPGQLASPEYCVTKKGFVLLRHARKTEVARL